MKIIADLHIHSRFSRACSKALTLENIDKYCQMKGVDVVATGDFTHPEWFKEMKEKLIEKEKGLYVLNIPPLTKGGLGGVNQTRFLCATEISCIYSKGGKVRRLHICVFAPDLETVEKINQALSQTGAKLKSDGRPILGMDVIQLAQLCWQAHPDCMIIPAHIWTPWFAMFGSKSGFDSIKECWGDVATPSSDGAGIYAIETGLSSDPEMNWRVPDLDKVSIISNSDAHSLPNIAREANVFEIDNNKLSYNTIYDIIKNCRDRTLSCPSGKFLYTIEFYPEEGMYHWDGHRDCNYSTSPLTKGGIKGGLCPVCRKPLTIGVLNRVEELASPDRPQSYEDKNRVPYKKLIELDKIIAESLNIKSRSSKQVQEEYNNLIKHFGTEFKILLDVSYDDLKKVTLPQIAEGIKRAREGRVHITPGFDGQYGKIKIFDDNERINYQKKLF